MTQHLYHAIVLVGLPGSGKTTYVNNFLKSHPDYVVLSSDSVIERLAKDVGMVYNDAAYNLFRDAAEKEYKVNVGEAINKKLNIIVDRTNQTVAARRKILGRLPKSYKKTAVLFDVSREELNKRLLKRELETGKHIPQHALDEMIGFYVCPSTEEGFNEIINA